MNYSPNVRRNMNENLKLIRPSDILINQYFHFSFDYDK